MSVPSHIAYAYLMSIFSQAVRYIIYTLWLIDTFKDIKPAWPVLAHFDPALKKEENSH